MSWGNCSVWMQFVFLAYPSRSEPHALAVLGASLVYTWVITGNALIMVAVQTEDRLHTPMYYFLGSLSRVEIGYTVRWCPTSWPTACGRRRPSLCWAVPRRWASPSGWVVPTASSRPPWLWMFPGGTRKNLPANGGDKRNRFHPSVGKMPWSREWQSTPAFLPGKVHRPRSLAVHGAAKSQTPPATVTTLCLFYAFWMKSVYYCPNWEWMLMIRFRILSLGYNFYHWLSYGTCFIMMPQAPLKRTCILQLLSAVSLIKLANSMVLISIIIYLCLLVLSIPIRGRLNPQLWLWIVNLSFISNKFCFILVLLFLKLCYSM